MTLVVPEKAKFLCGQCRDVLCDDCANIAAEYEYLYGRRTLELQAANDRVDAFEHKIRELERDVEMWQSVAKAGLPTVIQAWMDAEMAKARKAGRESMRRELKMSGFLAKLEEAERILARARQAKNGEVGHG